MEENRESQCVTGEEMETSSSSCPSSCPITQTHTLPTAAITAGAQQETVMQPTLRASPAILDVALTSPKMAPASAPRLRGSLSAFWHGQRASCWQYRWH